MIPAFFTLAQQSTNVQFQYTPSPLFAVVGTIIGLAIMAVICYVLYNAQSAIPPEHRRMDPGLIWLLMIPLFNFVWNFFVYPRVADSYASYFHSRGRTDVGDAGRGIGLAYAICAVCSLIPCLGILAGLAAIVLLILYLVKIYGLKGQIGATGGGFPVGPASPPPPPPAQGF